MGVTLKLFHYHLSQDCGNPGPLLYRTIVYKLAPSFHSVDRINCESIRFINGQITHLIILTIPPVKCLSYSDPHP